MLYEANDENYPLRPIQKDLLGVLTPSTHLANIKIKKRGTKSPGDKSLEARNPNAGGPQAKIPETKIPETKDFNDGNLRPLGLQLPLPVHPNAYIPGAWTNTKDLGYVSKSNPIELKRPLSRRFPPIDEAIEEFFEAGNICEKENIATSHGFSGLVSHQNQKSCHNLGSSANLRNLDQFKDIEPHMTAPLPNISKLDLSLLNSQKDTTNVSNAVPLAGAWEFNSCEESDECSLLHILTHELEHLDDANQTKSLWGILKQMTIGLNDEEYFEEYPWSRYVSDDREKDRGLA